MYFTHEYGHRNDGHDFARDWPDADVLAVIEFLKSVSGPGVLPADPARGIHFDAGNL